MKKISELELVRNSRIVDEIKLFELCDICNVGDPNAKEDPDTETICKKKCGSKLVKKCVPHFVKFGKD